MPISGINDGDDDAAYEIAPPCAGTLVELLRGVGYSTATALADLIDNSISASARNVWLSFHFDGSLSHITLLDDGRGMSEDELRRAMTLGGVGPLARRDEADLGRFGLGLKTASFSQCRCLTVASKQDGVLSCRRWDLDYLTRPDVADWRLLSSPRAGAEALLHDLDRVEHGTLVLWQGLDRVVGQAPPHGQQGRQARSTISGLASKDILPWCSIDIWKGPRPNCTSTSAATA